MSLRRGVDRTQPLPLLLACLALWSVAAVLAPSGVAAGAVGGARAPTGQVRSVTLGPLVDQTLWLEPGDRFGLTVGVAVDGVLVDPSVVVRFGATVSRDALLTGLEEGTLRRPVTRTVDDPVLFDGTLRVTLAATDDTTGASPRLPRLEAGVHPVVVELRDLGTPVASLRTHVVVLPDDAGERPALSVAVLLGRTGPPSLQPDGTSVPRSDDVAWIDAVVDVLASSRTAARDEPARATLLLGPELVEGVVLGGDPEQLFVVERLREELAGHRVLRAPYVAVDEALWYASGEAGLVEQLLVRGDAALAETLGITSTAAVAVLDPTAGDDTVEGFAGSGFDRFLVTDDLVVTDDPDPDGGPAERLRIGSAARASAFVLDAGPTARLADADPALAAVTSLAELATVWFADPQQPRGVVLAPTDEVVLARGGLAALLAGIADAPVLAPRSADALFSTVPVTARDPLELVDEPSVPVDDLVARRSRLLERVASYESLLGGDQPISRNLRDRLDAATADGLTTAQRDAYLLAVDAAVRRGTEGVTIPDGQAFNLTSRNAAVEVRILNGLGSDARTMVRFDGGTLLELPDGQQLALVLVPGENVLEVAVRSRSTGTARLDVSVLTADGRILLAEEAVRVRVTALSGVAVVLGGGAVLVLVVWWIREHRRGGRQGSA